MLNLYLVERKDRTSYDEYSGMVVVAETEYEARHMSPSEAYQWNFESLGWEFLYSDGSKKPSINSSWVNPEDTICTKIGQADPSYIKSTVILTDFSAG